VATGLLSYCSAMCDDSGKKLALWACTQVRKVVIQKLARRVVSHNMVQGNDLSGPDDDWQGPQRLVLMNHAVAIQIAALADGERRKSSAGLWCICWAQAWRTSMPWQLRSAWKDKDMGGALGMPS
jgi:hypothetical protein